MSRRLALGWLIMNISKPKIINIAISLVALIAIGVGVYFYYQLKMLRSDPQTIAKEEATGLVSKISKLYLLPIGEEPTIATVSDPTALKNQSFFNLSEKGDKVLIYNKAGKAILYRPNIDKIIETAPINNAKVGNTPVSTTTPNEVAPNTLPTKTFTKTSVKN